MVEKVLDFISDIEVSASVDEIDQAYKEKQDVQAYDILMVSDDTYLVGTCAMISENDTKIVYQSHLHKSRSTGHKRLSPHRLQTLLSSSIVKQKIRSKHFTQDIIDTLGKRIYELVLPFPKCECQRISLPDCIEPISLNKYGKVEDGNGGGYL